MSNPNPSNPLDTEEDILFGGGTNSPSSESTSGSRSVDEEDGWAPLPDSPDDPLSAPQVEAAPAATAQPIMDPGAPLPPEKPREPERTKAVPRIPPRPSAITPAHVTGPRPRKRGLSRTVMPLLVALAGAGAGAVMFLSFANPPLAGVAVLLGLIGALFTRVLLREPR